MRTLLFLLFAPLSLTFLPKDCGIAPEIKKETKGGAASLIGGKELNPPYPWIVLVDLLPNATPCTGTLVTKRHVITSAHCLFAGCHRPLSLENVTVCHGTTEVFKLCADSGRGHAVRRAFNLANYSANDCQESRDFAILELKAEIWPGVPICLPLPENGRLKYKNDWDNAELFVAGFGNNNDGDENTKLRVAKAGKRRHCGPGDGHLICTSWRTEESAICEGDSGGPLMELVEGRHVQVGINHMSNGGWCNVDSVVYSGNKDDAYQVAIEVAGILPVIQSHVNLK